MQLREGDQNPWPALGSGRVLAARPAPHFRPLPPPHQSYDGNRSRERVLTSSSGQYIYLNSICLKVSVSNYISAYKYMLAYMFLFF